ncbi:copper-binding protein [Leucobacter sp. UCD-THU]|uniref:cupredoxin domain-containing protein n=1 Tax=Leucobacter TaxID=55968 RepID=UPI0003634DBB|nr:MULTISPECIES: cupredoxin domain-containing protein [Leucobacter]EYT55253.1 copper-binding protein [Leucobacter sp. UCD-THU]
MSREIPEITRRGAIGGVLGAVGVGALASLTGCSPSKPDPVPSDDAEPDVTVHAVDNRFEPAEVEIAPGSAVRWVFEGTAEHDVVAADGSFVSELMHEGSYTHVFDEAGDFEYDCSVHPEMTGVVRVR